MLYNYQQLIELNKEYANPKMRISRLVHAGKLIPVAEACTRMTRRQTRFFWRTQSMGLPISPSRRRFRIMDLFRRRCSR